MKSIKSILILVALLMSLSWSGKAQTCDVDFDYTITNDTVIFQNLSTGIGINDTFEWDLDDGTISTVISLLHQYTNEGVYNVCLTRINPLAIPPCLETVCKQVVFCIDCVWPGDANRDKTANNIDVLYVGLAYGSTGPVRTDLNIDWAAKVSDILWTDINLVELNFATGVNYKHADCDGNGIIDENDLIPIDSNYNQSHNKQQTPACTDTNAVPLYFEILYDSIEVGTSVQINIRLGTTDKPAIDAYGIAYTLHYDLHLIDSNTISIDYDDTGFKITPGDKTIHLNKYFKSSGEIETAVSRTNQSGKLIAGEIIGIINFVMEDNLVQKTNLTDYLHLYFSDVYLIASDETQLPVCALGDSVLVYEIVAGMKKEQPGNELKIYPNPAGSMLNIESTRDEILSVNVYNLLGKNILSLPGIRSNKITLSLDALTEGTYFIEIETTRGYGFEKFLKM